MAEILILLYILFGIVMIIKDKDEKSKDKTGDNVIQFNIRKRKVS